MITTFLQGGLGNFLFQIAAATSLAIENNDGCVFSKTNAYIVHKGLDTYKDNILRNFIISETELTLQHTYNEPLFTYNKIAYIKDMTLRGYFQSEKYFTNHDVIRELFSPTDEINTYINSKYGNLLSGNTCSIHVRRGDYLKYPLHHPVCDIEYYEKGISKMPKDTKYLVFSDDISWCKENFNGDKFTFIENEKDYIDLYLMSKCKNNIIANSSFSWWGGWLNNNKDKIIVAPIKWFGPSKPLSTEDLIPSTWNRI